MPKETGMIPKYMETLRGYFDDKTQLTVRILGKKYIHSFITLTDKQVEKIKESFENKETKIKVREKGVTDFSKNIIFNWSDEFDRYICYISYNKKSKVYLTLKQLKRLFT